MSWMGPSSAWLRTGPWRQVAPTIISSTGSKAAGSRATSTECSSRLAGAPVLATWHWFLIPPGSAIGVGVFESADLPAHWARLDTFEGPGYERVVTTVHMPTGDVDASIYVLVQVQG
jgi:hypothetical protein